jgi:hypothetical protein
MYSLRAVRSVESSCIAVAGLGLDAEIGYKLTGCCPVWCLFEDRGIILTEDPKSTQDENEVRPHREWT